MEGRHLFHFGLFRRESRPACFSAEDPKERILISPASVEMGGVAIVSSRDSFDLLTADKLVSIIEEVSLDKISSQIMEQKLKRTQEELAVGIFSEEEINSASSRPIMPAVRSIRATIGLRLKMAKCSSTELSTTVSFSPQTRKMPASSSRMSPSASISTGRERKIRFSPATSN